MKKFIEITVAIKYTAGFAFMGIMAVYSLYDLVFLGNDAIPYTAVWQAILLAFLVAIQVYVCFTDHILKRASNAKRMAIFGVKLYVLLILFALIFHWFPFFMTSWLLFTGVFLALFAIVGAAFAVYFRITGNKYNQMLDAYRSRKSDSISTSTN